MKMETPKMDVVRFQEADVIASSPLALTGFNDSFNVGMMLLILGLSVALFIVPAVIRFIEGKRKAIHA